MRKSCVDTLVLFSASLLFYFWLNGEFGPALSQEETFFLAIDRTTQLTYHPP